METLLQIFMTVIAAFAFVILISKIASTSTNDSSDHPQIKITRDLSKRKSMKKVRFAIDHEEIVNKTVTVPLETESVVLENNRSEIEYDCGNETETTDLDVEENVDKCDENLMCMKLLCDDGIDEAEKEKEGLISDEDDSDDDDWEGVERSDLEKVFVMAADYGKLDDKLQSLGSDVQMQLYALHKVATEGPCREAQPMALKVSARAKWDSWQKLGNMDPEVAMEKYISLLSELVPEWSQGIHSFDKH